MSVRHLCSCHSPQLGSTDVARAHKHIHTSSSSTLILSNLDKDKESDQKLLVLKFKGETSYWEIMQLQEISRLLLNNTSWATRKSLQFDWKSKLDSDICSWTAVESEGEWGVAWLNCHSVTVLATGPLTLLVLFCVVCLSALSYIWMSCSVFYNCTRQPDTTSPQQWKDKHRNYSNTPPVRLPRTMPKQ